MAARPQSDGEPGMRRSLPMELMRAREAAMASFRPMLKRHGLTETQWRVIRVLADTPDIETGDLARASFLLSPSLTRILRHLERDRLVLRRQDPLDQRKSLFKLSARGRRLFDRVAPESEALYRKIESEFGADRLEKLYRLLAEFSGRVLPGGDPPE